MRVVVVADDLTGAAEANAALGLQDAKLWLYRGVSSAFAEDIAESAISVVDLDIRSKSQAEAEAWLAGFEHMLPSGQHKPLVFYKLDSLLRGHIEATVKHANSQGPVVMAMANPKTGRSIKNGTLHVNGSRVSQTSLWLATGEKPREDLNITLGEIPMSIISLAVIRGPGDDLVRELQSVCDSGLVAVCDCETQQDLDGILQASLNIENMRLVGAAGLARSLASALGSQNHKHREAIMPAVEVEVIIGSQSVESAEQVEYLEESLPRAGVALSRDPYSVIRLDAALVLSGGATARTVMDRLEITWIKVLQELPQNMTLTIADDGRLAVLKPGSYGGQTALLDAVNYLMNPQMEMSN